jgi:hypothetical protein
VDKGSAELRAPVLSCKGLKLLFFSSSYIS